MKGKMALVTGAGTGIGQACARALSKAGYYIGVHYNKSEKTALSLAQELPGSLLIQGDLSTIEGCDKVYDTLRESGTPLEVLVNNAGCVTDNPIFSSSVEEFASMVDLNMRGSWYLTKRLIRLLIRNGKGRVINISSVSASIANPTQSIYSMTKAAIESFTRVAAVEFAGNGILVNSVAPGFIQTEMTSSIDGDIRENIFSRIPLKRMGTPEEVADVVKFLATGGDYITGTTIHVNGGMYAS